jgi:hypothetical protein
MKYSFSLSLNLYFRLTLKAKCFYDLAQEPELDWAQADACARVGFYTHNVMFLYLIIL